MRFLNILFAVLGAGLIVTLMTGGRACADSTNAPVAGENPEATAWNELQQAAQLPPPLTAAATRTANQAKAFYLRFPDSTNVIAARKLECKMLERVVSYTADTNMLSALAAAQNSMLAAPGLNEDDRFDLRVDMVGQKAMTTEMTTPGEWTNRWNASQVEREKDIRSLIKDYPARDKPYQMLINFAANTPDDQARSIANEVLTFPASEQVKADANAILRRLDAPGKPLDIKFTALDGRQVDLSQTQGRVVLVDFWATWCGPCVEEIPNVKATYQKFHTNGFDVVGISFDSDKKVLERFVQSKDLPWPQFFDGQGWKNQFGVQYCIHSIPTMWLVDKKGNLRETNARDDLQKDVAKLLAE